MTLTKRSRIQLACRSLLVLMTSGWAATTNASSQPYGAEVDTCRNASCISSQREVPGAEFIFGAGAHERQDLLKPTVAGTDHKVTTVDWDPHGPDQKPAQNGHYAGGDHPGNKPEVIHTGSGKDIFPGPHAAGHPSIPTAVPAPAAIWLLLSGVLGLGLGARRRSRG